MVLGSAPRERGGDQDWPSERLPSQDSKKDFAFTDEPTARELEIHGTNSSECPGRTSGLVPVDSAEGVPTYRTYRRRWFGLVQLTLMNVMVSWDWLTYAPVAQKAADYYSVSESAINWISTTFFLAFVVMFPLTIAVLHRGPKLSMMFAAAFMLVGNWIRYGGSSKSSGGIFPCAMLGTIVCGFAQPFVLAAPTRFSDMWFTNRGRVAATAIASLANPFGAAIAQLINPLWVQQAGDVSNMTLYVAIMTSVACIPAFFVPGHPPTPVGPSAETPKVSIRQSISIMATSLEIWLVLFPFSIYVGFFNSISSLLNQMMTPYGFSDDEAGIGGAVLIVVGLVSAAIVSPICDRNKQYLFFIKLFVPIAAFSFFIFIWMPQTRSVAGPYVVLAILGGSCFALVPIALEFLSELSHPVSPEVTSTIAWAAGQFFGAIFIIISDALRAGRGGDPPKNMKSALYFQGALSLIVLPLPMFLGLFGRQEKVILKRVKSDEQGHIRLRSM